MSFFKSMYQEDLLNTLKSGEVKKGDIYFLIILISLLDIFIFTLMSISFFHPSPHDRSVNCFCTLIIGMSILFFSLKFKHYKNVKKFELLGVSQEQLKNKLENKEIKDVELILKEHDLINEVCKESQSLKTKKTIKI